MNQVSILLRMEKKSALAWAIGTGAYILLMGLIYWAMGGGEGLTELAESYPEEILEALGADDFTSVTGWLGAEFGALAPLVFGIFLITATSKQLAGAEEAGRLDHLLARPVSRGSYYFAVLAAVAIIYAAILAFATVMGLIGFAAIATGRELLSVVATMIELVPYGIVFIGLGGFLGAVFHRKGPANAIGAGAVAGFFLLDLMSRLVDGMEWVRFVNPIGYLTQSDLPHGEMYWPYWVFSILVGGSLALVGWRIFERKQIYA